MKGIALPIKGIVFPALVVVILQVVTMVWGIQSDNLASPVDVLKAAWLALFDGTVLKATQHTIMSAVGGLVLGGGLGLALGILLGLLRPVNLLLNVSLEVMRPVPPVALIPVFMLIFGLGYRMEMAIVGFACMWPVLIMARSAIMGIHPRLIEVSQMLQLSPWARVWKIVLPAALPRLFIGFRLAAGVALIVSVTVEIAANPFGLGYALMSAQESFRPNLMFAILLWIGLVGWALNGFLMFAQNRLFGRAGRIGQTP